MDWEESWLNDFTSKAIVNALTAITDKKAADEGKKLWIRLCDIEDIIDAVMDFRLDTKDRLENEIEALKVELEYFSSIGEANDL